MSQKQQSTTVADSPVFGQQLTEAERRLAKERFWRAAEQIGERNKDKDPDEELAFITEIVEEVRRERYEREQREAQGGR
jgi:uncharacterized protein YpuA (DUF1002 family)